MGQVDLILTFLTGVVIVYAFAMVWSAKRVCQTAADSDDSRAAMARAEKWLNAALPGLIISLLILAFRPVIAG